MLGVPGPLEELRRSKYGIATVAVLAIVWLVAVALGSHYAPLIAAGATLAILVMVSFGERNDNETPDGYFLANRKVAPSNLPGTFVMTNIGLFSSIFYSMVLSHYYGLRGMLVPTLAWFLGMYLFVKAIPRIVPFLRKGHTLHEFIAASFAKSASDGAWIRIVGAVVTGTLYWASIGVEVAFLSNLLAGILGVPETVWFVALAITAVVVLIAVLSGYKGVIQTDQIQFWSMLLGAILLLVFSLHLIWGHPIVDSPFLSIGLKTLIPNKSDTFLIASVVILVGYQFCIMDMWQRAIAVAGHFKGNDAELVKELQLRLYRKSILPFLIPFVCWYAMGIAVLSAAGLQGDSNGLLAAFVQLVVTDYGWVGLFIQSVLYIVFVIAVVSTADTFLVALTQTVMMDIIAILSPRMASATKVDSPPKEQYFFVGLAKYVAIGLGVSAVLVAIKQPDFARFWNSMYSLMFSLLPSVLLAMFTSAVWRQQRVPTMSVLLSIIVGFAGALIAGILGVYSPSLTIWADLSPVIAIVVSSVVLGGGILLAHKSEKIA